MSFPYLVLPEELGVEGWWNRPAEPWEAVEDRARLVLQQLLERHGGTEDRVAMVSHGGFFQVFTAVLLNMPAELTYSDTVIRSSRFGINNVSISRFAFTEQTIDIIYLNNTRFLAAELLT
jgi:2,3-bisphosphoglycerate-dependent phosphoglycerate mutase